mgnify:CR=1 FL=1
MKRAMNESADVMIDDRAFTLDNTSELDMIEKRVRRFKGVNFVRSFNEILIRLWLEQDDKGQKAIERKYKTTGINWKKARAKGAE